MGSCLQLPLYRVARFRGRRLNPARRQPRQARQEGFREPRYFLEVDSPSVRSLVDDCEISSSQYIGMPIITIIRLIRPIINLIID